MSSGSPDLGLQETRYAAVKREPCAERRYTDIRLRSGRGYHELGVFILGLSSRLDLNSLTLMG